jgi:hypothetical protein
LDGGQTILKTLKSASRYRAALGRDQLGRSSNRIYALCAVELLAERLDLCVRRRALALRDAGALHRRQRLGGNGLRLLLGVAPAKASRITNCRR